MEKVLVKAGGKREKKRREKVGMNKGIYIIFVGELKCGVISRRHILILCVRGC